MQFQLETTIICIDSVFTGFSGVAPVHLFQFTICMHSACTCIQSDRCRCVQTVCVFYGQQKCVQNTLEPIHSFLRSIANGFMQMFIRTMIAFTIHLLAFHYAGYGQKEQKLLPGHFWIKWINGPLNRTFKCVRWPYRSLREAEFKALPYSTQLQSCNGIGGFFPVSHVLH